MFAPGLEILAEYETDAAQAMPTTSAHVKATA